MITPEEKLDKVRDLLKGWDQITKGESITTRPLWDIIGRTPIEQPLRRIKPGTTFLHPDGRLCIKQHSEGWAVIREAPDMGPAKGMCALPHDFEGD